MPLFEKRQVTNLPSAVILALVQLSQKGLVIDDINPISPLLSKKV